MVSLLSMLVHEMQSMLRMPFLEVVEDGLQYLPVLSMRMEFHRLYALTSDIAVSMSQGFWS